MKEQVRDYFDYEVRARASKSPWKLGKYLYLVVLVCFVVGIVAANMMDREQFSDFSIWNQYFMERLRYAHISNMDLFCYILGERIPVMLLLLLFLLFTNLGRLAGGIFLSWQGFSAGFLMATAIMIYGIKGMLLMGAALFPHYLVYIPLYLGYIRLADFLKVQMLSGEDFYKKNRKTMLLLLSISLFLICIYITGIFLESYINPYFLKSVLYP